MGEWTSTLRARDAQALDALYGAMLGQGRGRTVFVAGDDRAGRSALLHDWLDGLAAMAVAPRVLGGVFEDGDYVPWERDRRAAADGVAALERMLSAGESAVSLLEFGLPAAVTTLLGHVLSKSRAGLELTHRALAAPGVTSGAMLVPGALRRLCEDGPVVCVIETDDLEAGGLWADLVERFARRVATDVRLLLVLAVDGPEQLGAHTDDEPAGLNVARQLTAGDVDVATWRWLAPLTERELGRWTGDCAPGVLGALLEITGGHGGFSVDLWRQWRMSGVVEDVTDGRWRFSGGRDRLFDDVDDVVYERVQRLGFDLNTSARVRRLLACAALEGRRFTAPAVAVACGWDSDETIDLLDDVLAYDRQDRPDGFVVDTGFVAVADERGARHLASYRFARELDWMILRHHGLSAAEQRHLAARLARALQVGYGGQAARVAPTLRRLFALAGDSASAAYYRRMADNGLDRSVLLWRARNVLADRDPVDVSERSRACTLLLPAAEALMNVGPFDDGLAFASAAQRLAERRADSADARFLTGAHHLSLGAYDCARAHLAEATRAFGALHDRAGQARARHSLAAIDALQDEYVAAREQFSAVLAVRRELGDRRGEADARHQLAAIDRLQGEEVAAREQFTAVLALYRELGDRRGEVDARHQLAVIDRLQGEEVAAREQFSAVLALRRELGDRRGEADARYQLAAIDRLQGEEVAAREQFTAVLALYRELGDRRGEADARHQLAAIDRLQGEEVAAREQFTVVLALRRELGDRRGEADARYQLAAIDRLQGEEVAAREQFTAVLALRRELGDRRGEADARYQLAAIDRLQGEEVAAREQFTAVLALRRELGDRSGEAAARHQLAVIDRLQGEYAAAREQFTAVLALYRELGDRRGEADTHYELATIDRVQGDAEGARRELSAVLELYRELGDRSAAAQCEAALADPDAAEDVSDEPGVNAS